MAYEQALVALADSTRRQLFECVRQRDYTVCELAVALKITQPAVSQHLRVLKDASLVTLRQDGVRRYYRPNPEGLADLRAYVESLWDDALAAYKAYAEADENREKEESK